MKKRFTEDQIIQILKEADAGMSIADLCRRHNVSKATYYAWKTKFADMDVSEARRLKALEAENSKLKRIVADQALDILVMKDILSKKW
jgi:putative transposase